MRRLIFLLLCLFLLFPQDVYGHLAGQDPYFKINDVYTALYPVAVTTLSDITLPQDIADKPYLVNTPITMTIDVPKLPFPEDIVKNMTFIWEFGDNTTGEGTENIHTYTKMGSYIVSIYADYTDATGKAYPRQLLQTTLLHVVPTTTYKLPKAVISINDEKVEDPLVDVKPFTPGKNITLDASPSESSESPITSYTWDLNTGSTESSKKITHAFTDEQNYYFPFLRVTTEDGFIADTYVELANEAFLAAGEKDAKKENPLPIPLLIGGLLGINTLAIGGYLLLRKKKRH